MYDVKKIELYAFKEPEGFIQVSQESWDVKKAQMPCYGLDLKPPLYKSHVFRGDAFEKWLDCGGATWVDHWWIHSQLCC